MSQAHWERWFAWHPVFVDAYHEDEILRGKMRYRVWLRWVERTPNPDTPTWKYRLIRKGN